MLSRSLNRILRMFCGIKSFFFINMIELNIEQSQSPTRP